MKLKPDVFFLSFATNIYEFDIFLCANVFKSLIRSILILFFVSFSCYTFLFNINFSPNLFSRTYLVDLSVKFVVLIIFILTSIGVFSIYSYFFLIIFDNFNKVGIFL